MPYFIVYAYDHEGMLEQRQALRPAHRARLRQHEHPVSVHVGGPLLSPEGGMIGTMLVIEANDQTAVETFVAGDPYVVAGLYRQCEITPFAWGLGAPETSHG